MLVSIGKSELWRPQNAVAESYLSAETLRIGNIIVY